MGRVDEVIGRARTVLVFGSGDAAVSVLSTVIARVRTGARDERITFSGPVAFDGNTQTHLGNVVVPIVDRILGALAQTAPNFELSISNLGAASGSDLGVQVSGFSADVPVAFALLSAALKIPVSPQTVITGHLASPDGDISVVRSLPAKIRAAAADPQITRILVPDPSSDSSVRTLLPDEQDAIAGAVATARLTTSVLPVSDLASCVHIVFGEEYVVLSGLGLDFFRKETVPEPAAHPLEKVVDYLAGNGEERFWGVFEPHLLAGERDASRRLLEAWASFHMRRLSYPHGTGARLLRLVQSLSPATRRMMPLFPLLERASCLGIIRLSYDDDFDDVHALLDAVEGNARIQESIVVRRECVNSRSGTAGDRSALALVLRAISAEQLAATVGLAVDTARSSYTLPCTTTDSYEDFLACLTSFHSHLLRHCRGASGQLDTAAVQADAMALTARAFANDGGIAGAWTEAMYGIRGGLRYVLDILTETYKAEEKAKRVDLALQQAMDPLDPEAREAFMADLLDHLAPHLPEEIAVGPPARFAKHWDIIVREYVKSMERVRGLLRSL